MEAVYLLLGGNLGDRVLNIEKAKQLIEERAGLIIRESALYETEPWGTTDSPFFLNCTILIKTLLEPDDLLNVLLQIEVELGRIRTGEINGSRTMDIDILLYGQRVLDSEYLQIPHPRMHLRKFVLIPLNSIASDFVHPVSGRSIGQLLGSCSDDLLVNEYEPVLL